LWATVNQSRRFARSNTVEAHLGLTPRRFQCGETDDDREDLVGGAAMNADLILLGGAGAPQTYSERSWPTVRGMQVAHCRGAKNAIVALPHASLSFCTRCG